MKGISKLPKGSYQMVKTVDIKGPYPWRPEDRSISRKMGQALFLTAKSNIKKEGIQEALHLVWLDAAPDHVKEKESFKPGYYTICGRNRWEIARELGITEVKAEVLPVQSYKKMLGRAIASNLFRKAAKSKEDYQIDSDDDERRERKEANINDDLSIALNRAAFMEVVIGYDPTTTEKLRAAKSAYARTKDEKKKIQSHREIVSLEKSSISLEECGMALSISKDTAFRCYHFRQAIKEDAKDSGLRPKDGLYDFNTWKGMAEKKGITAAVEAFMSVKDGKEKPEPETKDKISLKLQNADDTPDNLGTLLVEFQEKILAKLAENPEVRIRPVLTCEFFDKEPPESKYVETMEASKVAWPTSENLGAETAKLGKDLNRKKAKIEELERMVEDREEMVRDSQREIEDLKGKLRAMEEKPKEKRVFKKTQAERIFTSKDAGEIYDWCKEEVEKSAKKLGEVQSIQIQATYFDKKSDQPYEARGAFDDGNVSTICGWLDQELKNAIRKFGRPVKKIGLLMEFSQGPILDKEHYVK